MFQRKIKRQQGFVVLLLILVIASVVFVIAYNAVLVGLRELEMGYTAHKGEEVHALAEGCIEETLRQFSFDSNYVGGDISVGNGTCTIVVTNDNGNKVVTVDAQVGKYYSTIEANVTISTSPYIINSWEEK